MKKTIATLLLVNSFFTLNAQKLETKIPNTADVVITGNAENVFKLIKFSDIDSSAIGKEVLKKINRRREDKINSVENIGIDLKSNMYYFFKNTDSVSYHNILLPLNNRKQYESTLKEYQLEDVQTENGYSYILGSREISVWNDQMLLVVNANKSNNYFDEHKERFEQLKQEEESNYAFKKRIVKSWIKQEALNILNGNYSNTVSTNKKFQESKKKNSSATLWIPNYGELMSNIISSYGNNLLPVSYLTLEGGKNIYGIEQVAANVFFEKGSASILLDMEVSSGMKKAFKKIYNKKINNKLVNSFNHDKALAFWSVSMSVKEALIQYPELVNQMYGGLIPSVKEEIDIVGSLLSIILDEEAIGKLITGDALFVLNDFVEKEVSYKTYEYDEDYNRKEVTKTKKTVVPDFTLMIGSEERKIWEKILKIGQKHKLILINNNVYEFAVKKELPFDIYVVVKDEVLYLTSSKTNAVNLGAGRTNFTSTKHSKLIKKNASVVYADVNKIINKIPKNYVSKSEGKMINFSNANLKDAYLRVSKVCGSTISTEVKLNTQGKEENTLKLLLSLINEVAK
ncbi:hypothetical protein ACQY1Q_07920 [Tenacibaculum sp. TC6]|uniref:hypothetical protein n=1 Tax=Tenacibaculum sp. TC6 TaxID=3423223 RepID=UPI003D369663